MFCFFSTKLFFLDNCISFIVNRVIRLIIYLVRHILIKASTYSFRSRVTCEVRHFLYSSHADLLLIVLSRVLEIPIELSTYVFRNRLRKNT